MTPPTLTLLHITTKDRELRVQYEVANPADGEPSFLVNLHEDRWKQLEPPPRGRFSGQVAPTCFIQEDMVLQLVAGAVPAPANPNISAFGQRLPKAGLLRPGEKFEATIRAVIPLAEWSPYDQPVRSGPNVREIQAKKLRLVVAWFFEREAIAPPIPFKDQPGTFDVIGPTKLLRAEADAPEQVRVLLRTDAFRRFGPVDNVAT